MCAASPRLPRRGSDDSAGADRPRVPCARGCRGRGTWARRISPTMASAGESRMRPADIRAAWLGLRRAPERNERGSNIKQ